MKLSLFLLFALAAIVCATFNTTIVNNGVNYVVSGIPDSDINCSKASINFTKDDIAHFIGSTGGVSDDAKKGYPSPLPSDIAAVVLAKMESACNVTAGSIYANVAFIKKDKAYSLMDPVNPPSFYFDRYRVLYQKVRGENAMQYCTTVEFKGVDDYVKCPIV